MNARWFPNVFLSEEPRAKTMLAIAFDECACRNDAKLDDEKVSERTWMAWIS